MPKWMEIMAQRFEHLGLPLDGDQLRRAAQIGLLYSDTPERLHDLTLMVIAVEAHRRPDSDLPAWV